MDYKLEDALPDVYIEKRGKYFDLHWDSYEYEANLILVEKRDYIEGFMEGCYQFLSLDNEISDKTWSHVSGFVPNLSKSNAETLKTLIKNLLHDLVTIRYKHLKKQEDMPEPHKAHMKRLAILRQEA